MSIVFLKESKAKKSFFLAIGANLLFFLIFLVFAHPAYYCDEDLYCAYLLSGGFGNNPSELLHYDHVLHPLIGIIIKTLFQFYRGVNWYSVVLVLFEYLALSTILFRLLLRVDHIMTLTFYTLLLVIYEGWLLLNFGFNSTSLALTSAGIVLIADWCLAAQPARKFLFWAGGFLIIASFFRIHVMVPLIGFSLPFLLYPRYNKSNKQLGVFFLIVIAVIIGLNLGHKFYYLTNIPKWKEEETYRQFIYKFYNDSRTWSYSGNRLKIEFDLLRLGLPSDPEFLNMEKLEAMYKEVKTQSKRKFFFDWNICRWFLINERLYLFILLIIPAAIHKRRKSFLRGYVSLFLLLAGLLYLGYLAKTPEYFLKAGMFLWLVLMIQYYAGDSSVKIKGWFMLPVLSFFLFWGVVRIQKLSIAKNEKEKEFIKYYLLINKNQDKLFVNSIGAFPVGALPVFSDPREYCLKNFMDSEHFLMRLYPEVFKRFGVSSFHDIPKNESVIFLGTPTSSFIEYFKLFQSNLKVDANFADGCKKFTIHTKYH